MKNRFRMNLKETWKDDWWNHIILVLAVICLGSSRGFTDWPEFNLKNIPVLIWSFVSVFSGLGIIVIALIKEIKNYKDNT